MLRLASHARIIFGLLFAVSIAAEADDVDGNLSAPLLVDRDTLTDNLFGLGDRFEEYGLSVNFGVTQVYQRNVRGGLSTSRTKGEYTGSYDLEADLDFERLCGLSGGLLFLGAEGSWSEGIDAPSVGSLFGVNADAADNRELDVTELWYEQSLFDGALVLRAGKMNLGGGFTCGCADVAFDCNAYATCEKSDFLNGAFGNTATIPFPDNGLGLAVYLQPLPWFYAAAGAADADADARETGISTTFDGHHYYFYIFEAGVAPMIPSPNGELPGAYRFGVWYDRQPKDYLDASRVRRNDVGFYFSGDQMVCREESSEGDPQGLGLFARIGIADDKLNEIKTYWSSGAQYRGLAPGREKDVLAAGFAEGRLSDDAGFSANSERIVEVYYNAELMPWLHVSPDFQWIIHPGGETSASNAVVIGLRIQAELL